MIQCSWIASGSTQTLSSKPKNKGEAGGLYNRLRRTAVIQRQVSLHVSGITDISHS